MEFGSGEDKLHGENSGVTLPTISPRCAATPTDHRTANRLELRL